LLAALLYASQIDICYRAFRAELDDCRLVWGGCVVDRFGAETSGHTLLFDSGGRLLLSGGITDSRGHAGDNAGENAIVALINRQSPVAESTSVLAVPSWITRANTRRCFVRVDSGDNLSAGLPDREI